MIIGIIQARMGSTRLPGKVLKKIVGRPMLWHIINRLSYSKFINRIAIATSRNQKDKAVIHFANKNHIDYYAGSENDLVDRLYQTVEKFRAKMLVRITADCPLVDPEVVDKAISYYKENNGKYEYVSNITERTYPDGLDVEVFSYQALEKVWHEVKDPFRKEWVTANFFDHPEKYRLGVIKNDVNLSHLRWTVDYPEDLEFIREIYKYLYQEDTIFLMRDIIGLLERNPELLKINMHCRGFYGGDEGYKKALEQRK